MRPFFLLAAPLTFALLSPGARPARACATVGPVDTKVAIASETVLIVWDEKTRTQHFIRRASFTTDVPYFGFLVPTPTWPKLAEAPDELFMTLQRWTEPKVRRAYVIEPATLSADIGAEGGRVDVLEHKRVAGFDATVLRATDADALRLWLEKHGYDARPQVTDWLAPYVKAGWVVTAFQIAKKEKADKWVETKAVRMSFQTERPYFPYREPADQRERNKLPRRLLRVYLIAPERRTGQLEDANADWGGKTAWAAPLRREQAEEVTRLIGSEEVQVPEGAWLTELEDHGSPRPGAADLFFVPDAEQWVVTRPDRFNVVKIDPLFLKVMAICVLLAVALIVVGMVNSRLRRRAKPAGAG